MNANGREVAGVRKCLNWLGSGWRPPVLLAVFLLAYVCITVKPYGTMAVNAYGGLLDMKMGLSPAGVYQALDALGEQGRQAHRTLTVWLDTPFPAAYALFYTACIALFLRRAGRLGGKLSLLCALPWLAALFDWTENILVLTLLQSYPAQHMAAAGALGICTAVKFAFNGLSVAAILAALILSIFSALSARKLAVRA